MSKTERTVNRLLHDAEQADGGAFMAGMMHEATRKAEFIAERDRLVEDAAALDPKFLDAAWREELNFAVLPVPDAILRLRSRGTAEPETTNG